jgi:hypothetical protein
MPQEARIPQEGRALELEDSERFAKGEATAERVGWLVMALVVLAAGLGLFANGPLSHRTIESDSATVSYQRLGRNQGRTSLEVAAQPSGVTEGKVVISVSQDFLESYEVENVSPEPESTSTRAGAVAFSFAVEEALR